MTRDKRSNRAGAYDAAGAPAVTVHDHPVHVHLVPEERLMRIRDAAGRGNIWFSLASFLLSLAISCALALGQTETWKNRAVEVAAIVLLVLGAVLAAAFYLVGRKAHGEVRRLIDESCLRIMDAHPDAEAQTSKRTATGRPT
jgi:hypothetical protein